MIKLVAFDWNGTLLADTKAVLDADNEALKMLGRETITLKKLLETFDVPILAYYKNLGFTEKEFLQKHDIISELFHSEYENRVKKSRTRQNTRKVLKWLSNNKIDSLILSNHIKERIEEQLQRLKLAEYFYHVIGNEHRITVQTSLNKKQKLKKHLKEKNLKGKEVLIIGDGVEEILIAKELGSVSVAIKDGNYSAARITAAKPDYLISDLGNLINIIREINS